MPTNNRDKTMLLDPSLAKACEVRYEEIYKYSDIYQQVWDEIKYPDRDFVVDNADEIGDMLSQLFTIADTAAINRDEFVSQLSLVKDILIKLRADYCERETEKRAYPK